MPRRRAGFDHEKSAAAVRQSRQQILSVDHPSRDIAVFGLSGRQFDDWALAPRHRHAGEEECLVRVLRKRPYQFVLSLTAGSNPLRELLSVQFDSDA